MAMRYTYTTHCKMINIQLMSKSYTHNVRRLTYLIVHKQNKWKNKTHQNKLKMANIKTWSKDKHTSQGQTEHIHV